MQPTRWVWGGRPGHAWATSHEHSRLSAVTHEYSARRASKNIAPGRPFPHPRPSKLGLIDIRQEDGEGARSFGGAIFVGATRSGSVLPRQIPPQFAGARSDPGGLSCHRGRGRAPCRTGSSPQLEGPPEVAIQGSLPVLLRV